MVQFFLLVGAWKMCLAVESTYTEIPGAVKYVYLA